MVGSLSKNLNGCDDHFASFDQDGTYAWAIRRRPFVSCLPATPVEHVFSAPVIEPPLAQVISSYEPGINSCEKEEEACIIDALCHVDISYLAFEDCSTSHAKQSAETDAIKDLEFESEAIVDTVNKVVTRQVARYYCKVHEETSKEQIVLFDATNGKTHSAHDGAHIIGLSNQQNGNQTDVLKIAAGHKSGDIDNNLIQQQKKIKDTFAVNLSVNNSANQLDTLHQLISAILFEDDLLQTTPNSEVSKKYDGMQIFSQFEEEWLLTSNCLALLYSESSRNSERLIAIDMHSMVHSLHEILARSVLSAERIRLRESNDLKCSNQQALLLDSLLAINVVILTSTLVGSISESLLISGVDSFLFILENATSNGSLFNPSTGFVADYLSSFLRVMTNYQSANRLSEHIITSLEYACFDIIANDRSGLFSEEINYLINLQDCSISFLLEIYSNMNDQRRFILEECIGMINSASNEPPVARYFSINPSLKVLPISVVITRIVALSGIPTLQELTVYQDCVSKSKLRNEKENINVQDTDTKQEIDWLGQFYAYANSNAISIVNALTAHAWKGPKSSRMMLDMIIEDLLHLYTIADFGAAEVILVQFLRASLATLHLPSESVQIKGLALETLSSIAMTVLKFEQNYCLNNNIDTSSLFTTGSLPLHRITAVTKALPWDLDLQLIGALDKQNKQMAVFTVLRCVQWLCQTQKDFYKPVMVNTVFTYLKTLSSDHPSNPYSLREKAYLEWSDRSTPLSLSSALFQAFPVVLTRILGMLEQPQATLRTKSLRFLGEMATINENLLKRKDVIKFVAHRLHDPSVQVREASLEILGRYAIRQREMSGSLMDGIISCTLDPGLAVRKRAMKLLKDIYNNRTSLEEQAKIARLLILRLGDEETVARTLAAKCLEEIWITPIKETNNLHNSASTIDWQNLPFQNRQDIIAIKTVLTMVTSDINETDLELLLHFLKISVSDNTQAHLNIAAFKLLMASYFSDIVEGLDGILPLVQRLQALAIFAKAIPQIITSENVETLLPYLRGLNGIDDLTMFHNTVHIIRYTLDNNQSIVTLKEVTKSILGNLTKMPQRTLELAIPCVLSAATNSNNMMKVIVVIKACIRQLHAISVSRKIPNEKKLLFLILICGLFCQYEQFNSMDFTEFGIQHDESKASTNRWFVAQLILSLIDAPSPVLHRSALTSLGYICLGDFTLLRKIEIQQAFALALHDEHSITALVVLNIFKRFFQMESIYNYNMYAIRDSMHASTSIEPNQESVAVEIMHYFKRAINQNALSTNIDVAKIAISIMELISNLGLAHPLETVTTLVALEGSLYADIQQMALHIHRRLYDKYKSLWDAGRYVEGIDLMFEYRRKSEASPRGYFLDTFGQVNSIIGHLFDIIKLDRKARKQTLLKLLRSLDVANHHHKHIAHYVQFVDFISECLLFLDFRTVDEVLFVIHTIDCLLSTTGQDILELEEELQDFGDPDMQLYPFQIYEVTILMSVRQWLKSLYGLSEKRCQNFDPTKLITTKESKSAVKDQSRIRLSWKPTEIENVSVTSPDDVRRLLSLFVHHMEERSETDLGDNSDADSTLAGTDGDGEKQRTAGLSPKSEGKQVAPEDVSPGSHRILRKRRKRD